MNKNLKDVKTLVILGIMFAFTIILDLTPLGMIPLPVISASIVHLPTVVTGIILGPIAGAIMGGAMGVVSLVHAITRPPSVLAPLFINPLVSILPRIFIGVVSYYSFTVIKRINNKSNMMNSISIFIAGVMGSLTNTILVLAVLYILYKDKIAEILNNSQSVMSWIVGVATVQGVGEAIIIGIITVPIVIAWQKTKKRV